MEGLSAIISFQTPVAQGQLQEMLSWTGPLFAGGSSPKPAQTHIFKNTLIGCLCPESIISDPTGMIWLTFCGQHITAEQILQGYLEAGEESFKALEGEYAFLLLDKRSQQLFAVRDRLGTYPLYWHVNANCAYLSSSIKAILSTGAISPTADLSGIAASLGLGFISQDVTCIEGINRLLPGYYLKLSLSGAFSILPYWSYSSTFTKEYSSDFDTSLDIYCELERRIKAAINRSSTTSAGCLAGTIGSYIIWDTLKETASKKPQLIEPELTATDFLNSLIPMVWAMEMPNAEASSLQSWALAKACKEQNLTCYFDTGFSAEFYDYSKEAQELFQSHYAVTRNTDRSIWAKLGFYLNPRSHLQSLRKRQEATPQIAFIENKLLLSPAEFEKAAPELSKHFDVNLFIHQFYHLSRIPKLDASLFYLTMKSAVTDGLSESRLRIAQNHGIQSQSPFLDHHLLEFFSSIAPEVWASPDLISAFPQFWRQSREIKEDIASWPKTTPLPEALLLSKDVWPWFCGLEKGMLVDTGLVSASWIKKALATPQKQLHALYAMLILEIWMRLFIDLPLRHSNKDLKLEDLLTRG